MADWHFIYNVIEIGIWILFGVGCFVAALRHTGANRYRCHLAAAAFLLFAASDAVELYTLAWWKPWWLLAWKAGCVIVLLSLYLDSLLRRWRTARKRIEPADL